MSRRKEKPIPDDIAGMTKQEVLKAIADYETPESQAIFDRLVATRDEAQLSVERWVERGYQLRRHYLNITRESLANKGSR